jgi:hypothetical protein
MASTNVIESAFSIVEQVCKNLKRWHDGDQRERWLGSGLLVAEKQFRRILRIQTDSRAHQELEVMTPSKPELSSGGRRRRVGYAGVATYNGVPVPADDDTCPHCSRLCGLRAACQHGQFRLFLLALR